MVAHGPSWAVVAPAACLLLPTANSEVPHSGVGTNSAPEAN